MRNRALAAAARSVAADVRVVQTSAAAPEHPCSGSCPAASTLDTARGVQPFPGDYCPAVAANLVDTLRRPDLEGVLIAESRLHRYFRLVADEGIANLGMDLHDAESLLWEEAARDPRIDADVRRRISQEHDVRALRAIEEHCARHAKVITFVSPLDEARFTERYRPANSVVIPNSVALTGLPPSRLARSTTSPDLLFLGHLGYLPNVEAISRLKAVIFPAIRKALPEATLTIAGRAPGRPPRTWPGAGRITRVENPAEVGDLLDGRILVVPLALGSGSRLKILEAFAAGVPVISSAKGVEGIEAEPGTHYLEAGPEPESYVEVIRSLLADPANDLRRRRDAYALVRTRYSWEAIRGPMSEALDVIRQ